MGICFPTTIHILFIRKIFEIRGKFTSFHFLDILYNMLQIPNTSTWYIYCIIPHYHYCFFSIFNWVNCLMYIWVKFNPTKFFCNFLPIYGGKRTSPRGIEFNPYIHQVIKPIKNGKKQILIMWYNTIDVPSGCIWNLKPIIENVFQIPRSELSANLKNLSNK